MRPRESGSSVLEDGRDQSKAWTDTCQGHALLGYRSRGRAGARPAGHLRQPGCLRAPFISEQQAFDAALRWYQASEYAVEISWLDLDLSQDDNRRWVIWKGFEPLNSGEATL